MAKYLIDGQEVDVVREVDGGFLYHNVLLDYEGGYFVDDSVTFFTEKLYDFPPETKYSDEILALQQKIQLLNEEISTISDKKRKEQSLLVSIRERDFIQNLVDYINGDFKYLLWLDNMELVSRDKVYVSPYVKITNKKTHGFSFYILRNDSYEDYTDRPVRVFDTAEEATLFAREVLINRLKANTEGTGYRWKTESIMKWYKDIHSSCGLLNDDSINTLYNEKLLAAKKEEEEKQKKELLDKIAEAQAKLDKVNG